MDEAMNDPEILAELAALNVSDGGGLVDIGEIEATIGETNVSSDNKLIDSVNASLTSVASLLNDQTFEETGTDDFDFENELSQLVQEEVSSTACPQSSTTAIQPQPVTTPAVQSSSTVTPEVINSMKQEMFALNNEGKVKEAGAMRKKIKQLESQLASQPASPGDITAAQIPAVSTPVVAAVQPQPVTTPTVQSSSTVTPEMINSMKQEMFALNNEGKVKEAGAMRKKIKQLESQLASQPASPGDITAAQIPAVSTPVVAAVQPQPVTTPAVARDQKQLVEPTPSSPTTNPLQRQSKELRDEALLALKSGDRTRASSLLKEAKELEAKLQVGKGAKPKSPEPVVTINASNMHNLEAVIAAKRREAVDHHKAGRVSEARSSMAEAKRLELQLGGGGGGGGEMRGSLGGENFDDLWDELETAIQEVITEHQDMDAGGGATWKSPSPDLPHFRNLASEVAKRRKLKYKPPLFQLERVTKEREAVVQSLRSDELVVSVTGLEDMVDDEKSRLGVGISIDTSLLLDETQVPVSNGHSGTVTDGRCSIDHTATFTIKRSQKHARRYEKRGLDLTLIKKTKSFFGRVSEEVLAEGKLKVAPLINKCIHTESMSLHLPGQPRKMRRGQVLLELRVHHPIGTDGDGRDLRRVTMTNITLAPWGDGSAQIQRPPTAPTRRAQPAVPSGKRISSKGVAPKKKSATAAAGVDMAKLNKEYGELSLQERKDPLSAQHLVSEAVINHLLASTPEPMVQMTLKNQLLLLQVNFDNGNMTPDIYLSNLTARISRDVFLAKYLIASQRRAEAVKVMERTKIMKKEIVDLRAMLAKGP